MFGLKHSCNSMMRLVVLTGLVLLVLPTLVSAEQNVVAVEGVNFTMNAPMSHNLRSFIGKTIHITLDSGQVIGGIVKDVGDEMLHLEKLVGKEYYDSLIRIEDISAFNSRFRMLQR